MTYPRRSTTFSSVPAGVYVPMRGLECVFEFNGLRLNDRRQPDQYRIHRIAGLDDPDMRVGEEENADRDGTRPLPQLYGGRTITMTGEVRAGNMAYLRYMWQELKAAFDDAREERELLLRYHDWRDDFYGDSSDSVMQDYRTVAGLGSSWTLASGDLSPTDALERRSVFAGRDYTDQQATLHFKTPSSVAAGGVGLALKVNGSDEQLLASWTFSSGNVSIWTAVGATTTFVASGGVEAPAASTEYWLRAIVQGNEVVVELHDSDPDAGSPSLTADLTHTLSGAAATKYGANTFGKTGFWVFANTHASTKLMDLDVRSINAGDLVCYARKFAKVEGDEQFNGLAYVKPFVLTLRASSPLLVSRMPTGLAGSIPAAVLTFPGGGGGIPFPAEGGIVFGTSVGQVENLGYAPAHTLVRFDGPTSNPGLVNSANNTRILLNGTINDGDSVYVLSGPRPSVYDRAGASRYDMLDRDSRHLMLEPGVNPLTLGADEASGSMSIEWRHSFR